MADLEGLKIKVEPTGRGEVEQSLDKWPVVEGLNLIDTELSGDALSTKRAVRVRVGDILQPAINLDGTVAAKINPSDAQLDSGMQFSNSGASKSKDVSFYPSQWAKRKSAGLKTDTMEGR